MVPAEFLWNLAIDILKSVVYLLEMSEKTPLLILSDAVSATSGLARIARDLSVRIHEHMGDIYRVGTCGYGGPGSRKFGFPQYHAETKDWVVLNLPEIWRDFAGEEKGILFSIWDISRLNWLANPATSEDLLDKPILKQFLLQKPFAKWLYPPMDATGPNDRLTFPLMRSLHGFDRIIAYSQWAGEIIDRTMGLTEGTTPSLPHGIDSSVFYQHDRNICRASFPEITESFTLFGNVPDSVHDDEVLISIVATNQARKDFHIGIETAAILAKTHKLRLWIKADILERNWSIPALLVDYGIVNQTMISLGDLSDDAMAQAYSASDVTLGIGLGEGYGYPIQESLFCGTPCIHANYGGAPEYMLNPDLLVDPVAYRYEGVYSCQRPVCSAQDWAERVNVIIGKRTTHNGDLDWVNLWPRWQLWFRNASNPQC